jgi:hypothetical protein
MGRGRRHVQCSHSSLPPRRHPSPAFPQQPSSCRLRRRRGAVYFQPAAQEKSITVRALPHTDTNTLACTHDCMHSLTLPIRAHAALSDIRYVRTNTPIQAHARTAASHIHTGTHKRARAGRAHTQTYANAGTNVSLFPDRYARCLIHATHTTTPKDDTTHSGSPRTFNAAACAHTRISWRARIMAREEILH